MLERYRKIIPSPAKKQKLERASIEVEQPRKNATKLVNEVIVIDDPADIIPFCILFSITKLVSV
jgi:hypothetical protein